MAIETKQLHALSKIYQEAVYGGAKKEAPKDTRMVVTAADKKANTKAYQNYKAGNKAYKAADHLKNESMQHRRNPEGTIKDRFKSKQTDPSKDNFTGIGDDIGEIMRQNAAMKKAAAKKTKKESYSDWRQDLKEIPNYEQIPASAKKRNEKISEKNVKNTVKINPEMKEEKRWQDDDGDGKWYEKSDVDGKISKREKKSKKHNCASKVKHEEFGVGDCISEAHDLDENGNVAHYDVEFKEYIVKGIPVEELEILEGSIHEHVIHEQKKSYETTKRKEVLAALKRDKRPLDKKTKEKIAAKIVKDKGDTSKSDDRYAYEDHVWDKVADMLTELGKLNDVRYRVEGYQRNPEEGERKESAAAKKGEAIRGQARRRMPPRGNKDREEFERWYAANVR